MASVVVVGSVNEDLVIRVPHLPAAGETVTGTEHFVNAGGKGANQAVGAAKLGASVTFVGCVGGDQAGRRLRESLRAENVDDRFLAEASDSPTGVALITVDDAGENTISVSPGSNLELTRSHVEAANQLLADADVTLAQLEIPLEVVERAADLTSGLFVLNPAPVRTLPSRLLGAVDVLVPNVIELETLARAGPARSASEAMALAETVLGPAAIVVTLGSQGAAVVTESDRVHLPAPRIEPVDTTGAGDAFCAALSVGLAKGEPLVEAARFAVAAGAAAALTIGAQRSMPTTGAVNSVLRGS